MVVIFHCRPNLHIFSSVNHLCFYGDRIKCIWYIKVFYKKKFTPRKLKNWHKRDKTLSQCENQWVRPQLEGAAAKALILEALWVFSLESAIYFVPIFFICWRFRTYLWESSDSFLSNQHRSEVTEGLFALAKPCLCPSLLPFQCPQHWQTSG